MYKANNMTSQNNLELRYQCLALAQKKLLKEFNNVKTNDKTFPTTDDIFKLAELMYEFICNKPVIPKKLTVTVPVLIPFDDALDVIIGSGKVLEHRNDQKKMFDFLTNAKHGSIDTFKRGTGVTSVTAAWSVAKCLSVFNHSICLVFENAQMTSHAYGIVLKMLIDLRIPTASRQPGKYLMFANGSSISFLNVQNKNQIEGRFYKEMICDSKVDLELLVRLEAAVLDVKNPACRIITMRSQD